MKIETKNKIEATIIFVLVIAITIFLIQIIGVGIDLLRQKVGLTLPQQSSQAPASTPSATPDAEKKNLGLSADFEKFNSYQKVIIYPEGIETPTDYILNPEKSLENAGRKIKISGQIIDAYIYIKAGANDKNGKFTSILNAYDGVWFYLTNGQFLGGQLDLSRSIYGQTSEITTLLYNLNSIPLAKDKDEYRKNNYQVKSLLAELKEIRFIGALVSTDRYGRIDNLEIGYKCAEGNDCKIELLQ